MKKILILLILSLVAFNNAFGCSCSFDEIKGATCEMKYLLCKDTGFEINICDNIKEKSIQYENNYTKTIEEYSKLNRTLKAVENKIENERRDPRLYTKRFELEQKMSETLDNAIALMRDFLGEKEWELYLSDAFRNEVDKVLGD